MFLDFFSNNNSINDLSALKVDIHSHILPGVDDGCATVEESLEIIYEMYHLGYTKLICTPHINSINFLNNAHNINQQLILLKEALLKFNIPVEIDVAAEYFIDDCFIKKLEIEKLLTFGNKYLLFELSFISPVENILDLVTKMQNKGYQPVLAHPERYTYWHDDFSNYTNLIDKGVIFQANLSSFSPNSKYLKVAERLVKANHISFLGSDTHSIRVIEIIQSTFSNKLLSKLINSDKLLNKTLLSL